MGQECLAGEDRGSPYPEIMERNYAFFFFRSSISALYRSAHTGQSVSEFAEETERKEPYVYEMRKKQGKCLFLKEDNICSIYALRPLICRFYPFMLETEGNSHKFTATSECPRIASPKSGECGKVLDFFYFRRLLKTARSALQDSAASESV